MVTLETYAECVSRNGNGRMLALIGALVLLGSLFSDLTDLPTWSAALTTKFVGTAGAHVTGALLVYLGGKQQDPHN